MKCTLKFLINNYKNAELVEHLIDIADIEDPSNITMKDVVKAIMGLDKEKRSTLADYLRSAKVQPFSEKDIKNHRFISNITIDGLKESYPDLAQAFPNLLSTENCTIIKNKRMVINGNKYFGRCVDAGGNPVFFINTYYGAEKLFNYLDVRNKLQQAIDDDTLKDIVGDMNYIKAMETKYELSIEEILYNYLDNTKKYTPFKTDNGTVVIPAKILNTIYTTLQNKYDSNKGKSDLHIAIRSSSKDTKNRFIYEIPINKFYEVSSMFNQNAPTKEQWDSMSNDEIISYIKSLFTFDAQLIKANIEVTGGDKKGTYDTLDEKAIKKAWDAYTKANGIDMSYQDLLKRASANKESAIGLITPAFIPNSKISIVNGKFKVEQFNQSNSMKAITKKELEEKWQDGKLADKIKKDPKKVIAFFKEEYPNSEVTITTTTKGNPKLTVKVPQAAYTTKSVKITFPWTTLGDVYNFGYDSNYIFSPVNTDGVDNGKYNGAYIYQCNKDGHIHYFVSRSIINPNSYAHTYNSLEGAKAKIDDWNNTQTLKQAGLYSIKLQTTEPRTILLEMPNLTEGSLITTLDLSIPKHKLPAELAKMLDFTAAQVRNAFANIDGIENIITPEQAAALVHITADKIINKRLELQTEAAKNKIAFKEPSVTELINLCKGDLEASIQKIITAKTKTYLIQKVNGKLATVKLLKDNGNDIDISGKTKDDKAITSVLSTDMDTAIEYFNKAFGTSIIPNTQEEVNKLAADNNFSSNGVRAFILDGQIHINSNNANLSDLFHEISHIIMGIMKVQDFNSYQRFINSFRTKKDFSKHYDYINRVYKNFAQQDKLEECVANMIASKIFNSSSLAKVLLDSNVFSEQVINEYREIFKDFTNMLQPTNSGGLNISTLFSQSKEQIQQNMRLTTFIQDNIDKGIIQELNCE